MVRLNDEELERLLSWIIRNAPEMDGLAALRVGPERPSA